MPPNRHGPTDLLDADISFPLDRLYDHYNMDHIPTEKRLNLFKQRDLPFVKHYKAAVKIFGGPLSRKRIIVAPPMETPFKHKIGAYHERKSLPLAPLLNSELKPQIPPERLPLPEEVQAKKDKDKEEEYQKWVNERKKLRGELDSMGLNEKWLQGKGQRTDLETRVLQQIKAERLKKPEEPVKVSPPPLETPPVPDVKIPCPMGLQALDEHLQQKKMRLIDLFRQVDKDKNWKVSKDEFRQCIQEANLPITALELEDMIMALDSDLNDEVDYQELSKGRNIWRKERRESKRLSSRESHNSSFRSQSGTSSPVDQDSKSSSRSQKRQQADLVQDDKYEVYNMEGNQKRPPSQKSSGRSGSSKSKSGSSSSQYLELPENDIRPEQLILDNEEAMVDLRKHDQVVLSRANSMRQSSASKKTDSTETPQIIKIGHKAIDNHSLTSTLGGEMGELVDKFRQLRLKEYYDVIRECEETGVPLTQDLLENVLLYPPDKPYSLLKKKLRSPNGPLLSSRFANPGKVTRQPLEVRHKDKMKRSKSGKLLIDSRHVYPQKLAVTANGNKESLSTGRAVITRKVDCWMTFEEYEKLTSHLAVRYQQLHGRVEGNAFWPGHLLSKLRLCMPNDPQGSDRMNSVFRHVKQGKKSNLGYNNDLQTWPVSDHGYVQYGECDPPYRRQ